MKGSHGDTTVYLDQEFTLSGDADTALDVENMYLKTKVGPLSVTAGNWTGGINANTGQILENARSTNKISVSTAAGPVKLGFWTSPGTGTSDGFTVSGEVAGVKIGLKESSNSYTDINVSGEVSGVSYRLDSYNADAAARDAVYGMASKKFGDVTLTVNHIDAQAGASFTETDGVFDAYDHVDDTTTHKITRVAVGTSIAGNSVTLAAQASTEDNGQDNNSVKVTVSRALDAGMVVKGTFQDADNSMRLNGGIGSTSTATLELDVSF
jgi:hypothetical protein